MITLKQHAVGYTEDAVKQVDWETKTTTKTKQNGSCGFIRCFEMGVSAILKSLAPKIASWLPYLVSQTIKTVR